MGTCHCEPPPVLHIVPSGVHLPDGTQGQLLLVDEAWSDVDPLCSVCAVVIESTFFRCVVCEVVICRRCVSGDTTIVECDCEAPIAVTGVQLAALRASAQLAG